MKNLKTVHNPSIIHILYLNKARYKIMLRINAWKKHSDPNKTVIAKDRVIYAIAELISSVACYLPF